MQAGLYESLIVSAQDELGIIRGTKLLNRLNNRKLSRSLTEAFTSEQMTAIREFAETAAVVQRKSAGPGGVVMQLAQGGAILGLVTGGLKREAATLFIVPSILAKMITNPTMAKFLTEGLTTSLTSPNANALVLRLLNASQKVEGEEERRQAPANQQRPSFSSIDELIATSLVR